MSRQQFLLSETVREHEHQCTGSPIKITFTSALEPMQQRLPWVAVKQDVMIVGNSISTLLCNSVNSGKVVSLAQKILSFAK